MPEHDLYEVMQTTRAVRRLRPDPIPEDALRRVLTAATWGPSGGNRQPWRIIAVRDPATKGELEALYAKQWGPYAAQSRAKLQGLPESIVTRSERALRAGDYLAAHWHEAPVILVFCFDPGGLAITDAKLSRPSVVGGASIYPAVQNALLACRAEGLGCVLTTLLCADEPKVRALLEIPEPWATAAFVPIGYPVGRGHGPLSRRPVEQAVYLDRWGSELPR
jgi:nitroreductase